MIIGSFPIGKFTYPDRRHEIKAHEMDFFFGGERNLLWKLLGRCFGARLKTREEVKKLLEREGIAVGDLILSCRRKSGRASDSQLYDIELNLELLEVIKKHNIRRVYFTSRQVQKWFHRLFPDSGVSEDEGVCRVEKVPPSKPCPEFYLCILSQDLSLKVIFRLRTTNRVEFK